ncbi:MAG TPA: sulfite exporter TauE/SafE family protein [Burkholderiaceae bacterium]|nr:sulfite exporter TauE/SafE family protein [Burkholderiaceae bacterium]
MDPATLADPGTVLVWLGLLAAGTGAGVLGGVVGFGSSVVMMPLLALAFGPKAAVPMMAVASLMANLSRVAVWWREVDLRAVAAYVVPAVPAAALGARTMLALDARWVELALGAFLIAMVPARRALQHRHRRIGRAQLAAVGAAVGFLTGIVASTGPVNAPFFLAHGLVKGAYLGTEALASAAVYLAKALVFRDGGALPVDAMIAGAIVGSSLMLGSWLAKRLVERMEPGDFRTAMDVLLAVAGLTMLVQALRM